MVTPGSVGQAHVWFCSLDAHARTHTAAPRQHLSDIQRDSLAQFSLIIPRRAWECEKGKGQGKLPHSLKFPHTLLTLTGLGGRDGNDRTGSGLGGLIWILEMGAGVGATVEKWLRVRNKWSITSSTGLPFTLCLRINFLICSIPKGWRWNLHPPSRSSLCHIENQTVWHMAFIILCMFPKPQQHL